VRLPVTTNQQQHHVVDAEAIWRDLHGPLLAFIARRVADPASAEDILQEVMLSIHRHSGDLADDSTVGGWVHQIARNAIIDNYRRAAARRERPAGAPMDLEQPAPLPPEPGTAELRTELAACLEPLLARLPVSYREALRLTELGGLTQAEAAIAVGLSTSGMKTRVQRARRQLKALFVDCCQIELDRRGGIIDYQPHGAGCNCHGREPPPDRRDVAQESVR